MAGDTGKGQLASFKATPLTQIQRIDVENTGDILSETVSDGVITKVIGTGWRFKVQFVAPTSQTHTLEGTIKAGEEGALDLTVGATRYTSSAGRSGGFTKSSPSNNWITYNLTLMCDGDPTLAAKA